MGITILVMLITAVMSSDERKVEIRITDDDDSDNGGFDVW